jgi:hypothetical protein
VVTCSGHDRLEWLDPSVRYAGFTLESEEFADLTGDGQDEAIIILRYYTGGTQTTNYVYIYTLEGHKPKLLAYCHSGSRAAFGLYGVYGKDGYLVFELLDPRKAEGDCCSSGILISRYRWRDDRFELVGPIKRRNLPPQVVQ